MKRTSTAWTVVLVSALTACLLTALTGSYRFSLLEFTLKPFFFFPCWLNLMHDFTFSLCHVLDKKVCLSRCYKVGWCNSIDGLCLCPSKFASWFLQNWMNFAKLRGASNKRKLGVGNFKWCEHLSFGLIISQLLGQALFDKRKLKFSEKRSPHSLSLSLLCKLYYFVIL